MPASLQICLPSSFLCCSKAGSFTKDRRSATCQPCPLGYQCPLTATATPTLCPKGRYASKEGSRVCSPCPVNTFASVVGSTVCTPW